MKSTLRVSLFIVSLWTTLFSSCGNDDEKKEPISKYITIDSQINASSRVADDGNGSMTFEASDQVSVYAWIGSNTEVAPPLVVNNSVNTFDGSQWIASPQMLWLDLEQAHYFIGIYPVRVVTDFKADAFALDSSSEINNDVLVANLLGEGHTAQAGIVPLRFNHIMSNLKVNLTFRTQWTEPPVVQHVSIANVYKNATINYLTSTVSCTGDQSNITLPVVKANINYGGIMIPQRIQQIRISIDNKEYIYNIDEGFDLVAGKIQTINLIVGRDQITLGSISINDWGIGNTINGGEAQEIIK